MAMGRANVFAFLVVVVVALVQVNAVADDIGQENDLVGNTSNLCRDGFVMEGSFCVQTISMQSKVVCDSGVLEGSECAQYCGAEKQCSADYHVHGDSCVKYDEALPTPNCADGYNLEGFKCRRTKSLEPKCPERTTEVDDGRCVLFKPSMKRCPEEFRSSGSYHKGRSGGKCVKVTSVIPSENCTDGFSLVEGGGECELLQTLEPQCPRGSKEEGDICVLATAAQPRCRDGFDIVLKEEETSSSPHRHFHAHSDNLQHSHLHSHLDSHHDNHSHHSDPAVLECRRKVLSEPEKVCEAPSVLSSDGCVETTVIDPQCRAGAVEEEDGLCASYKPAEEKCPEAFDLLNGVCKKAVTVEAAVSCSEGYDLEGTTCVRIVASPMVCPSGSKVVGDGCVVVNAAEEMCTEEGFEIKTNRRSGEKKCVKKSRVEATVTCAEDDYVLSDKLGYCEKKKICEAVEICDEGAREGDRCVVFHPVNPIVSCPDGYDVDGRYRCVQSIETDCSTVKYEIQCHEVPDCGDHCQQQLEGRALRHFRPFTSSSTSPGVACERVAVSVPRMCSKRLFADAQISCPDGSRPHGRGCMSAEYTSPTTKCAEGQLDATTLQCIKTLLKRAVYSCPDGFEKKVMTQHHHYQPKRRGDRAVAPISTMPPHSTSNTCYRRDTSEVEYFCIDDEAVLNGRTCETFVEKECEGGVCQRKVAVLADFQCPDGFHKTGGICETDETAEVILFCSNEEDELRVESSLCVFLSPKVCSGGSCERENITTAQMVCPEGSRLQKSDYDHYHRKHPRTDDSGFHDHLHRHDGRIVGSLERHYHGEAKCVSIEVEEPELFCRTAESTLRGVECVKFLEKQCPGGLCQRTQKKAVVYECPEGYQKRRSYDAHTQSVPDSMGGLRDRKMRRRHSPMQIMCARVDELPFEHYCSKGDLEGDKCAKYFEKSCCNEQCEVVLTKTPTLTCDEGFELDEHKRWETTAVPLCRAAIYEDPVFKCHNGEIDESGKLCRNVSSPKYICPKGSSRAGGECQLKKYEKPKAAFNH